MGNELTFKDFATDQEVRWCPGCGDYAILKAVQRTLAQAAVAPEKTVFVSGIGCSSRLPYYVNTFGFHTIHGRAPAVATGIKLANPELEVWVITGDGDGLSIGGNQLMHALRRNVDLNILLFNNEIYGLTKGQYSPTSRPGTRSPTSPKGSVERSVHTGMFALGAGATFIARCADIDQKNMLGLLSEAREYKGTSFVEILQNCIVYNKDIWNDVATKKNAPVHSIQVRHGKPLKFGTDMEKGLRLNPATLSLSVVTLGADGVRESDLMVHDETNPVLAQLLLKMTAPLPVAMGVIHRQPAATFEELFWSSRSTNRRRKVDSLIRTGTLLQRQAQSIS